MKIIKETCESLLVIEKSRFITHAYQVTSVLEANEIINKTKKKYWDANHNCSAFIIGQNQEFMRSSDDGEPSGTAGVPILETLKKSNVTDTLIIVTRYFGGIKLGAGGLIRAYSKATSTCLSEASFIEKKELASYKLVLDYKHANLCLDVIKDNTHFIDVTYQEKVAITFATNDIDSLQKTIQDIIGNSISFESLGNIIIDIQV